ncbi:flavodoxin [Faecalimonas umbilicata]|nr:flavodoxin [Faecalimonas umbilicata]
MKKTIIFLLSLFMIMSLAACGNTSGQTEQPSTENNSARSSVPEETSVPEESESETESVQPDETEEAAGTADIPESGTDAETEGTKVLVAYFSATNTTEGVAEHIANGLNADLYEIIPEEPYTDEDLDYNDNNSRSTLEMNDPSSRPAIAGSVENMDQYTIVFLGYPIWWGDAPRILSTFVESYDFSGKTIVPFCTSGGSGIGSSASNLEQLTGGATWLPGQRLNGSDSQDTVMEWVNGLGLNLGE